MKLKSVPALRERKRYVFFRVHSTESFEFFDLKNAIMNSLMNWMGERRFSLAKPWVIKNLWDGRKMAGVARCSHTSVDDVKMGLALVRQIGDSRVVIESIRVSGTIKSGKKKVKISDSA